MTHTQKRSTSLKILNIQCTLPSKLCICRGQQLDGDLHAAITFCNTAGTQAGQKLLQHSFRAAAVTGEHLPPTPLALPIHIPLSNLLSTNRFPERLWCVIPQVTVIKASPKKTFRCGRQIYRKGSVLKAPFVTRGAGWAAWSVGLHLNLK